MKHADLLAAHLQMELDKKVVRKHTPTPWVATAQATSNVRKQIRDSKGRLLAEAVYHGSSDEKFPLAPEAIANTDFIVLACNCHHTMLEALKESARFCNNCGGTGWADDVVTGEKHNVSCSDCACVRAAIGKVLHATRENA